MSRFVCNQKDVKVKMQVLHKHALKYKFATLLQIKL